MHASSTVGSASSNQQSRRVEPASHQSPAANESRPALHADQNPQQQHSIALAEHNSRRDNGVFPILIIFIVTALLMAWLIFHRELGDIHGGQEQANTLLKSENSGGQAETR